jgi:hypothetical protein
MIDRYSWLFRERSIPSAPMQRKLSAKPGIVGIPAASYVAWIFNPPVIDPDPAVGETGNEEKPFEQYGNIFSHDS